MSKVELSVVVTLILSVIGFAFWCGTLQGRIDALEKSVGENVVIVLRKDVAKIQHELDELKKGALTANDLTLNTLKIQKDGRNVFELFSDNEGGVFRINDLAGKERGQIAVGAQGVGATYRSTAVDGTKAHFDAKATKLPASN